MSWGICCFSLFLSQLIGIYAICDDAQRAQISLHQSPVYWCLLMYCWCLTWWQIDSCPVLSPMAVKAANNLYRPWPHSLKDPCLPAHDWHASKGETLKGLPKGRLLGQILLGFHPYLFDSHQFCACCPTPFFLFFFFHYQHLHFFFLGLSHAATDCCNYKHGSWKLPRETLQPVTRGNCCELPMNFSAPWLVEWVTKVH